MPVDISSVALNAVLLTFLVIGISFLYVEYRHLRKQRKVRNIWVPQRKGEADFPSPLGRTSRWNRSRTDASPIFPKKKQGSRKQLALLEELLYNTRCKKAFVRSCRGFVKISSGGPASMNSPLSINMT